MNGDPTPWFLLTWVAAVAVGAIAAALYVYGTAVAKHRAEAKQWKVKAGYLVAALSPFAPMQVKLGPYPRPYWHCPTCALGGLLGSGSFDENTVADNARKHFIEEHLTRENFDRAGEAMCLVLGDQWWRR